MKKLPIFIFLLCFYSATPRMQLTTNEKLNDQVIKISVLNIEAKQLDKSMDEMLIELRKLENQIE